MLDASGEWETLRELLDARLARADDADGSSSCTSGWRACAANACTTAPPSSATGSRSSSRDPRRGDVWHRLAERYEQEDRLEDAVRAMEAELACGARARPRAQTLHGRLAELALHAQGDEERAARCTTSSSSS